ncbi:hypothetical protein F5876DRAFT_63406 [Lentinula aff. lateritia]|uniref:Uncharacterized protein n=1 Tax=Lentinula aff. lateritia TaxID=2804960 RepID=A0ACC1U8Q5_9AGAR|nr:hypothetical protein F5876DRAFT_63406 [Lentinula aff. lateritia]
MFEYNSGLDTTLRPPTPHVKLWMHLNNYHHDHVMFEYNSGLDTTLRPPTPHGETNHKQFAMDPSKHKALTVEKATTTAVIIQGSSHKEDETVECQDTTRLIVWLWDILKIAHINQLGIYFRSFRYWLWDLKLAVKNLKWSLGVLVDPISNFLYKKNMTISLQNDLEIEINLNVGLGTCASEKA